MNKKLALAKKTYVWCKTIEKFSFVVELNDNDHQQWKLPDSFMKFTFFLLAHNSSDKCVCVWGERQPEWRHHICTD